MPLTLPLAVLTWSRMAVLKETSPLALATSRRATGVTMLTSPLAVDTSTSVGWGTCTVTKARLAFSPPATMASPRWRISNVGSRVSTETLTTPGSPASTATRPEAMATFTKLGESTENSRSITDRESF
ncbi:MAG TPA: hypothetical protein VMS99_00170 [Acidimicrobiia bacterium]|nr:hypothetical protein [Acidimicrobiia bacterium]